MVSAQATTEPAPEPRPGPTGNAAAPWPIDEVGDDQEIAGKAHLDDDAELVFEPLAIGLRARPPSGACQPALQPRLGLAAQLLGLAGPLSDRKGGRIGLRGPGMKAQRRAIDERVVHASGRSANRARISAALLKRCSGVSRRRFSWLIRRPSAMQSSASCASYIA